MPLDKRAIKILYETYWSPAGWRRETAISPEDFTYAKTQGVMFDPISLSHDEASERAVYAATQVSQNEVVNAFIASLGTRRLDLRSALGSYAVARHVRTHTKVTSAASKSCAFCGLYDASEVDLNILNFERLKWGGVRHDELTYVAFDLQALRQSSRLTPEKSDLAILRVILDTAGSMPPTARLSDLDKALAKVFPSNSAERRVLIQILGYAGILVDPNRPSFRRDFVPVSQRERTSWHKDDWPYPVQWWNGSHGVDQLAVDDWFPRAAL